MPVTTIPGVNSSGSPIGTIKSHGGSVVPVGFLLCDGSAVSRITYSDLFSIIGTTHGAGDGSTTFNLPQMAGVSIRGAGTQLRQTFTITSGNATSGAVYSNNSQTFTVLNTISASTTLICSGSGAPSSSGTLTKVSGTGDTTITFSAVASVSYSAILGQHQNDQMQGHRHDIQGRVSMGGSNAYKVAAVTPDALSSMGAGYVMDPTTDGTNGSPRTGAETRMANIGVNFIIAYA